MHCDHIGHMNVASYVAKFDEANWRFFCALGLTPSYLRGERYGMAGVQQNITYRQELFAGDVIEIRSRVLEIADKRIRFEHEMRNIERGEVAAVCRDHGRASRQDGAQGRVRFRPRCATRRQALLAAGEA